MTEADLAGPTPGGATHPSPEAAFSSVDQVFQCLVDVEKINAFERAIRAAVRPGARVLDVGTGSGILAMIAADAGGAVTAVEHDPYVADVARANVAANGLSDRVEVVTADARTMTVADRPFDVVCIELLTTGCIDEDQVAAGNNLWQTGQADARTTFIPRAQTTTVALAAMSDIHGFRMPMVRHLWPSLPLVGGVRYLSPPVPLDTVSFDGPVEGAAGGAVALEPYAEGTADAVVLASTTIVGEGARVGSSFALNAPVAVPIQPLRAAPATPVRVEVTWEYGGGFASLRATGRA